jgi:hypothetical protein
MTGAERRVPQPTRVEPAPPPPRPALPTPSPLRLCQVFEQGRPELALVYKRSYDFEPGRPPVAAAEQAPLDPDGAPYDPLPPRTIASFRSLPEVIGMRTGTDVIVQGHARSAQPVLAMRVGVQVGAYRQLAEVFGTRYSALTNGRIAFTEPEPFTEMALRYENAYGGRDPHAETALLEEVARSVAPDELRRVRPLATAMMADNHPLMYPRNRFGKGYALSPDAASLDGRELPNLERHDDRLTPERFYLAHPLHWLRQPVPIGFDFLDPRSFPRCAMLGMPPASLQPILDAPEVALGLTPPDFALGNVFSVPPEQLPQIIHPSASRCASLGLALPFLGGTEEVVLVGMDEAWPQIRFQLPPEVPLLSLVAAPWNGQAAVGRLHQVRVAVDERRIELIWVARLSAPQPLSPDQIPELEAHARLELRSLRS